MIRYGNRVRVTQSEYDELRRQAEAAGQLHWFPPSREHIQSKGDLIQAEACAAGSRLLDVIFGEVVFGDTSAREAYERGEIPDEQVIGMSREELERRIAERDEAATGGYLEEPDHDNPGA